MTPTSLTITDWPAFVAYLSQFLNLAQTARAFKALIRRRRVTTAESLLRLCLGYGPCGMSLRRAAAWAEVQKIADIKDTSLLERLRNSNEWLSEIVRVLLSNRLSTNTKKYKGRLIRLVDGTTLSQPGSKGTDWRLHAVYDLANSAFSFIKLTDKHTAESLVHDTVTHGEIRIADRNYARVRQLVSVVKQGADFLVRIGWSSLRLQSPDGQPFDLMKKLSTVTGDTAVEWNVMIVNGKKNPPLAARIIVLAKTKEATENETKRIKRRGARKQCKTDQRSFIAGAYLILITSLLSSEFTANEIASLYRFRWQIELAFKRLKSILHLDQLRAYDAELAMSWIYSHIIAALVLDSMTQSTLEFPDDAKDPIDYTISVWRVYSLFYMTVITMIIGKIDAESVHEAAARLRRGPLYDPPRRRTKQTQTIRNGLT